VATALEAFDQMIKFVVRPALRDLGFKGSGTTFTWPSDKAIAHIGVQKSQFGDRHRVKFTLNVTVADVAAWELAREERLHLPKRPAPNTLYGSFIWQRRVGELLPNGEDHWWYLDGDADVNVVGEDVVRTIETYVVPTLREHA
jgi:Domain of unknown function (DUF4304)